jgi:hypothetical protein
MLLGAGSGARAGDLLAGDAVTGPIGGERAESLLGHRGDGQVAGNRAEVRVWPPRDGIQGTVIRRANPGKAQRRGAASGGQADLRLGASVELIPPCGGIRCIRIAVKLVSSARVSAAATSGLAATSLMVL